MWIFSPHLKENNDIEGDWTTSSVQVKNKMSWPNKSKYIHTIV